MGTAAQSATESSPYPNTTRSRKSCGPFFTTLLMWPSNVSEDRLVSAWSIASSCGGTSCVVMMRAPDGVVVYAYSKSFVFSTVTVMVTPGGERLACGSVGQRLKPTLERTGSSSRSPV